MQERRIKARRGRPGPLTGVSRVTIERLECHVTQVGPGKPYQTKAGRKIKDSRLAGAGQLGLTKSFAACLSRAVVILTSNF
jgi:hypothetical protein